MDNIKEYNLFLCDSPYQILSAVNIIEMQKARNRSLMCVINMFTGCNNILYELKRHGFNIFEFKLEKLNKAFKIIKYLLHCCQLRKITQNRRLKIFVSSQSGYVILFYFFLYRKKYELVFYDEGLYSYTCFFSTGNPFEEYFKNHAFFKYIFGKKHPIFNKTIYLYAPKFAREDFSANFYKIEMSYNMCSSFLKDKPDKIIAQSKIIIFDQYFLNNSIEYKKYLKLLHYIYKNSNYKICIKKHPRNEYISYESDEIKIVADDNNLWEAEAVEIGITDRILITYYSSAVFMPAILNNCSYTIILLYKLILKPDITLYKVIDDFVTRFQRYSDNVKVFVPSTVSELIQIIKDY